MFYLSTTNIGANVARDLCIFMKEVGWIPDRAVMNENSIWNSIRRSEGVLLYTLFIHTCRYYLWAQKGQQVILRKKGSSEKYIDIILGHKKGSKLFSEKKSSSEKYIDIIWGHKKGNKLFSEKNSSEQKVPEEILKIEYCIVGKKKKKKENYICLLKRNIISIRATGVNLVIKRNSNKNSGRMKLLTIFDNCVFAKEIKMGNIKKKQKKKRILHSGSPIEK